MTRHEKLDSRTRYLLSQGLSTGEVDPSEPVGVFLRGRASFTPQDIAALEADGARIRTVAGDVMTADIPFDAIGRVSDHEFVIALQVSQPLFPEQGDQPPEDVE
jgi:hypothetical protein